MILFHHDTKEEHDQVLWLHVEPCPAVNLV
jgi:hypothetical protein